MSDDTAAGPDLDARVAVEVLGMRYDLPTDVWMVRVPQGWVGAHCACPEFSTSMERAMLVVERMREQGWLWSLFDRAVGWSVVVTHRDYGDEVIGNLEPGLVGEPSLPLAICTGALRAAKKMRMVEV